MNNDTNVSEVEANIEKIADETKREFIGKFGKFAATVPAAGFVLMTAGTSVHAVASNCMSERKASRLDYKQKWKASWKNTAATGEKWRNEGRTAWKETGKQEWKDSWKAQQ